MPLTAIVLTLNAERVLEDCLGGLGFADEILVVDSGSRDRTPEIASAHGAKVLRRKLERFDAQRNWAMERASSPWVLFVDADERVPAELAAEIRATLERAGDGGPDAYSIPRINYFLGRRMRFGGWGSDRVVRLMRRRKVRWEGPVHEKPRGAGAVGALRNALIHHPYPTLSDYWDKMERYSRLKAAEDHRRGRVAGALRILFHPKWVFGRMYVLRGGFLDGKHGLVLALMSAFSSFTRAVRLWELGLAEGREEAPRPAPVEAPSLGGPPLTVLIPSYNEEVNIEEALDSALWADEVLVVDSFSADSTVELARRRGARVLEHAYINSATQKNWALPRTRHRWVMILDADERITPELAREVREVLAAGPPEDGYVIGRINHFLGRRIDHCGWNRDTVLRLMDRDRSRYQELEVHAEVEVKGKVSRLCNRLLHYTYRSVDQYWPKFRQYTDWGSSQAYRDGRRAGWYHLAGHPMGRFHKMYIVRGGFLDGTHGLVISLLSFFSVFNKYAKLWERGLPDSPARGSGRAADAAPRAEGKGG